MRKSLLISPDSREMEENEMEVAVVVKGKYRYLKEAVAVKGKYYYVRDGKLDLTGRKIANITEIKGLKKLTKLKKLDLSWNQIEEIKGLEKLTQLEILKLNNNEITEIKGLEHLTNLQKIKLHDNPIRRAEYHLIKQSAQEVVKYCQDKARKEDEMEEMEEDEMKEKDFEEKFGNWLINLPFIKRVVLPSCIVGGIVTILSGLLSNTSLGLVGVGYWGYPLPWIRQIVYPGAPKVLIWQFLILDWLIWTALSFGAIYAVDHSFKYKRGDDAFEEAFEAWLWERDLVVTYFDTDGVDEDTGMWLMSFLRGIFRDEKRGYRLSQKKLIERINKWLETEIADPILNNLK